MTEPCAECGKTTTAMLKMQLVRAAKPVWFCSSCYCDFISDLPPPKAEPARKNVSLLPQVRPATRRRTG